MLEKIKNDAIAAVNELLDAAKLQAGDLLVIGCSSSEMVGEKIGTHSSVDAANALADAILPLLNERGVAIAVQCCEHLNRAIVTDADTARRYGYEPVNVVPQPKAGGSFATAAYHNFKDPVALENIKADAYTIC